MSDSVPTEARWEEAAVGSPPVSRSGLRPRRDARCRASTLRLSAGNWSEFNQRRERRASGSTSPASPAHPFTAIGLPERLGQLLRGLAELVGQDQDPLLELLDL